MIDWSGVFEESWPKPGGPEWEIRGCLDALSSPITEDEAAEIVRHQKNPWLQQYHPDEFAAWKPIDPMKWRMPARPVPESYVSFACWSDGGDFRNGERYFQMWGSVLRTFLTTFLVPEYMPDAVPFAFNGGGVMYMFDMRQPARGGEYPIICARTGEFGWQLPGCFARMADGFEEACRGRSNVEESLSAAFQQALAEQRQAEPSPTAERRGL